VEHIVAFVEAPILSWTSFVMAALQVNVRKMSSAAGLNGNMGPSGAWQHRDEAAVPPCCCPAKLHSDMSKCRPARVQSDGSKYRSAAALLG